MNAGDRLSELCASYRILAVYSFGSRAVEVRDWLSGVLSNLPLSTSDIDIGVLPLQEVSLTIREKALLAVGFEDLLGVSRVDLVVLPEAGSFIALNVIRGERVYCTDSRAGDEYELFVMRRAADLAPFERQRLDMIERS